MADEKLSATITAEEARTLIEQEERRKTAVCLEELQAVLEKHGRELRGVPFYTADGRTDVRIDLVPRRVGG